MDAKSIASKILDEHDEGGGDEEGGGLELAASNVMSAMKDNNAGAFAESLKEFVRMCSDYE